MRAIVLTIDPERFPFSDFIRGRLDRCVASLHDFAMPYEVFYGPISQEECDRYIDQLDMQVLRSPLVHSHDLGCFLSHTWAYNRIIQFNEPHVVLEFDAYMIKAIDFEVEDGLFYRLHNTHGGEGHLVTPKAAQEFIDNVRNRVPRKWYRTYDVTQRRMSNRVDMNDYVRGNEVMDDNLSARLRSRDQ